MSSTTSTIFPALAVVVASLIWSSKFSFKSPNLQPFPVASSSSTSMDATVPSSTLSFKFPVASSSIGSSTSMDATVPSSTFSSKFLPATLLASETSEQISSALSAVDLGFSCSVFSNLVSGLETPIANLINWSAVASSKCSRWTSPNFTTSEKVTDFFVSFSFSLLSSSEVLHGSVEVMGRIFSSSMNLLISFLKSSEFGLFLLRSRILESLSF